MTSALCCGASRHHHFRALRIVKLNPAPPNCRPYEICITVSVPARDSLAALGAAISSPPRPWHNRAMTDQDPKLEPRPLSQFFSDWCVQVTWPSGHTERVTGFRNEAHARGWIEHDSKAWIAKARGPRR